ncbi:MAG: tRNA adenosine(34) deaminase TadA [Bacillota bacterium]|nr:tRNA adenosine(34) deaminase TadA [Bacillota bacterium]
MNEEKWMCKAIKQAEKALQLDEVPIGCVIVKDGKVIASGYNKREKNQISLDHAEIIAIRKACKKLGTWRLEDCELYVTLEPCPMCAGAIIQSRIPKVIYGASDPKGGSVYSVVNLFEIKEYNHHPEYKKGVLQEECAQLLKDFFKEKRKRNKEMKKKNASLPL